jgi:hypothetical protein
VGFEPMIPTFEQAKTVHALDRAATVIDPIHTYTYRNIKMDFHTKGIYYNDVLKISNITLKKINKTGKFAGFLKGPLTV